MTVQPIVFACARQCAPLPRQDWRELAMNGIQSELILLVSPMK
jgi:hypothetical protein